MALRSTWRLALVTASMLLAVWSVAAQETTPIVVLPERPASLDVAMLEPTSQDHAVLRVRWNAGGPVELKIPAGTVFLTQPGGGGGGEQSVMVSEAASLRVMGENPSPVRHAAAPGSPIELVAASDSARPAGKTNGHWTDIPLAIVCFEEKKPDPQPTTRWQLASAQEVEEKGLGPLSQEVRQLADGIAQVDQEIDGIASRVHAQRQNGAWQLIYDGEPMSEADAQLFLSTDWSVGANGSVSGLLNRSVVVQFAVWALSDGTTRTELAARLSEPKFADLQPRERSLRWSIEHLLTAAGFSADKFVHDGKGVAEPEKKSGR